MIECSKVVANVSHFHPSLIFSSNAKSLPLDWSPVGLAYKYKARTEVFDRDKRSSLMKFRPKKSFVVEDKE